MDNNTVLAISPDKIHMNLLDLPLSRRGSMTNSIYSHLKNPNGKGEFSICTGEGYNLRAPYTIRTKGLDGIRTKIVYENSLIPLNSFRNLPKDFIFRWVRKRDFDVFFDAIIPELLKKGYHFKQSDMIRDHRIHMSIFSDQQGHNVDIFNPKMITNFHEVLEYCEKHNIKILSTEPRKKYRSKQLEEMFPN